MQLGGIKGAFVCLLCLIGVLQACDFRQMIEERPVKLPQESSELNEVPAISNSQEDQAARQSINAPRRTQTVDPSDITKPNPPE